MTKVYKLTVYVVDHDNRGLDDTVVAIEQDSGLSATVGEEIEEAEVEWHDEIDLNYTDRCQSAYEKLFA